MGKYLSTTEIEALYPNEWVFADQSDAPKQHEPFSGRVVWHHPDRDEFDRGLETHRHVTRGAIWYTGKPDPNEIWFLNL
jgi:hypothetical protein